MTISDVMKGLFDIFLLLLKVAACAAIILAVGLGTALFGRGRGSAGHRRHEPAKAPMRTGPST
ncbi:MAG TPA: hypothetical protein VIR62_15630 [Allosphingosinicella sp.]